jgi:hypothetical protein
MLSTSLPSNVIPLHSGSKPDRPLGMAFIPIALDELGLSMESFRVFCHLCRRGKLVEGAWVVWESLERIGKVCFGGSFPNAASPSLRIRTSKAIKELESRGLVEAQRDRMGNNYRILPQNAWRSISDYLAPAGYESLNARGKNKARSQGDLRKTTPPNSDLHRSQGDLPAAEMPDSTDSLINPIIAIDGDRRSRGDHNGYINKKDKKEERESLEKNFPLVNNSNAGAINVMPTEITDAIDDSETGCEFAFEYEAEEEVQSHQAFQPFDYDWSLYPGISDPIVPREFWDYTLALMVQVKEQRLANKHPQPIADLNEFTKGVIRKQGLERFLAWSDKQSTESIPESVRPARPDLGNLYPQGPWTTEEGKLSESFVRDRAEVWRTGDTYQAKAFGSMAIEDVLGAVCKHYAKPDNRASLEIDWHSYHAKNHRYLENVQQRLHSGAEIPLDEQAEVLDRLASHSADSESPYGSATSNQHQIAPSASIGLHWSEVEPKIDPGLSRSLLRQFWRDLEMSWDHPDLIGWMDRAREFFGFAYDPAKASFYSFPDRVACKLAADMEVTISKRLSR